jgi:hypothetical protein
MKNYNHPNAWADFLQRHGVETDAPPPPPRFLQGVERKERVSLLLAWAQRTDPERVRARSRRSPQVRRTTPLDEIFGS